jgi:hypothetical protein
MHHQPSSLRTVTNYLSQPRGALQAGMEEIAGHLIEKGVFVGLETATVLI